MGDGDSSRIESESAPDGSCSSTTLLLLARLECGKTPDRAATGGPAGALATDAVLDALAVVAPKSNDHIGWGKRFPPVTPRSLRRGPAAAGYAAI